MYHEYLSQLPDTDSAETAEWIESLESILSVDGENRARYVVQALLERARELNVGLPPLLNTPYINTILRRKNQNFPGMK